MKQLRYPHESSQRNEPLYQTFFITCSDARFSSSVLPTSEPTFVMSAVGNSIAPFSDEEASENSMLEYAVDILGVRSLVIFGHTSCEAMRGPDAVRANVLAQLENLRTYPVVCEAIDENRLVLRGLVFDEANQELLRYDAVAKAFLPMRSREKLHAIEAMWTPGGASHYR